MHIISVPDLDLAFSDRISPRCATILGWKFKEHYVFVLSIYFEGLNQPYDEAVCLPHIQKSSTYSPGNGINPSYIPINWEEGNVITLFFILRSPHIFAFIIFN